MLKAAPGAGITIEVGDEFTLNLKNRVQVLWRYTDADGDSPTVRDTNDFSIRRARTSFGGHLYDKTKQYFVQLDWARDGSDDIFGTAGTDILLDAWFNWDFWQSEDGENDIGLRIGAQKPHHGREFQGSSANLEHTERSLASNAFSGNRVIGAWLHGHHMEGDKLHWWLGVGNSDPAGASTAAESGSNVSNTDNEVNFFLDVRFDPFGDFGDESYVQGDLDYSEEAKGTIGASAMFANLQPAVTAGPDVEALSVNIYTAWHYQGLSALGEVFLRNDDPDVGADADATGYAVSAGYVLQPAEEGGSQWGFAARWSMVDQDDPPVLLAIPEGDVSELTGSVSNYYKKNALKSQLSLTWQNVDPDVGSELDNYILDVLFQFIF
jgi:hypothetical protein